MKVFGLLHVAESQKTVANLRMRHFTDRIAVYVNCATTLSRSLAQQGLSFALITNDKAFLERVSLASKRLHIEEIAFDSIVPAGVPFFSAHFKIDLFKYLADCDEDYVVFCDVDVMALTTTPESLRRNAADGVAMAYDISDQVIPAYGSDVIARDLQRLHGFPSEGRWYGGEFLAGRPTFFRQLSDNIAKVYPDYVKYIGSLHHVSDEMPTNAALEMMRRQGVIVADAGSLGIVGRYWNAEVRHVQRDAAYFLRGFLLHTPADKRFLAELAMTEERVNYAVAYRLYLRSPRNRLLNAARKARSLLRRVSPDYASALEKFAIARIGR
jgi:hypothetical protein